MRWWGIAIGAVTLCACTLFTPFGTDLTSGDPAPEPDERFETGTGSSSGSTSNEEAGPDAPLFDAPTSDAATTCTKAGDVVHPIRAFDATPSGISPGVRVCNVDAVLVEDGIVAGLDRLDATYVSIDGQGVVSCIGVEMAPGVVIDRIHVRAQAVQNACGGACQTTGCDTGHSFPIYVGTSATDLVMAENGNDVNATPKTLDVAAPASISARFIVVCRSTWGLERDDIAVDSIAATCR